MVDDVVVVVVKGSLRVDWDDLGGEAMRGLEDGGWFSASEDCGVGDDVAFGWVGRETAWSAAF